MSRRKAAAAGEPSLQHNTVAAGGQLNAVQHGDQYVYNYATTAPYRVSVFGQATRPMTDAIVRKIPSRMLAARNHLVPFHPRPDSMAWLASWRDAATPGLSVRLIYATGGQGKTRFAHHFCAESESAGWTVVLARHSSDPAAAGQAEAQISVPGRGLLLLIDYADRWNTTDLLTCLRQHAHAAATPIRALLLGRSAGGWSDTITNHLAEDDGVDDIDQLKLPPLAADPADRAEIYRAARNRFAAADLLNVADIVDRPLPDLTDPDYERVLDLHMLALADVHAAAAGSLAPADQASLTAYLLKREQDSWRTLAQDPTDPGTISAETMGRASYLATLLGPMTHPDAGWLLRAGQLASSTETVNDILAAHSRLYPPPDPATNLSPLYPDRVGEDFLALSTPGHEQSAFAPDPWAADRVANLLQRLSEDQLPTAYTTNLLIVLIETARRWPHILTVVTDLLTRRPTLALVAGGTAITRLVEIPNFDLVALQALERQLPAGANIDWDIAAAVVTRRIVADASNEDAAPPEKARLLAQLGYRLANAGDRIGAHDATFEAVVAYRELAESDSAYTPDLVSSLNNLSIMLAQLGRHDEALTAATEAVAAYRELAEADSAGYTPGLAASLNNLGSRLAQLGRHDEALTAATEAVAAYRELAEADSAGYTPGLAASLNNLGARLAELGRREEALSSATEAANVYRSLAKANPAAYTPDLAMSLNNLGGILAQLGRYDEGLTAAIEATNVYRTLAKANPAAYTPDLAMSLNNLGNTLAQLGRHDEGSTAAIEAANVYRTLAKANPAAYTPDLAMSLNNLGNRLAQLGRHDEALSAATEAVTLRRALAKANPAAYTPELAKSLNNLGNRLAELGRHDEALSAATEAVTLRRALAKANPAAYTPDLAMSLNNLGGRLAQLGRYEEALTAAIDAANAYRSLAKANPAAYTPELAKSLNNLGNVLAQLGRHDEALTVATEARDAWRVANQLTPSRQASAWQKSR